MNFQSFGAAAPVTTLLFGINVALYILAGMQSKNMGRFDHDVLLQLGMSSRELLWEGDWLRLIAPNFLHANMLHILFNMSTLMSFGPYQERIFGSSNFASLYLLSGVTGFCFSQIIGGNFSVGASGSLFGLIGADLALHVMELPAWSYAWRSSEVRKRVFILAFFIGLGFLGSWFGGGMMSMDNWCHLGGAIAGFTFGALFESWRRRKRLNIVIVALPLIVFVLLVVGARWSVWSPYYHVHQGAVALSEKRSADARKHFAEAQHWAARWGIQNRVARIEAALESGELTLDDIHKNGYRTYARDSMWRTR